MTDQWSRSIEHSAQTACCLFGRLYLSPRAAFPEHVHVHTIGLDFRLVPPNATAHVLRVEDGGPNNCCHSHGRLRLLQLRPVHTLKQPISAKRPLLRRFCVLGPSTPASTLQSLPSTHSISKNSQLHTTFHCAHQLPLPTGVSRCTCCRQGVRGKHTSASSTCNTNNIRLSSCEHMQTVTGVAGIQRHWGANRNPNSHELASR